MARKPKPKKPPYPSGKPRWKKGHEVRITGTSLSNEDVGEVCVIRDGPEFYTQTEQWYYRVDVTRSRGLLTWAVALDDLEDANPPLNEADVQAAIDSIRRSASE